MARFFLLFLASVLPLLAQSGSDFSAFANGEGIQGEVNAIVVQPDGKIIIGGLFTAVNGTPRSNLARLNSDGTLDNSYVNTTEAGVNGPVYALALQPDGALIVGGAFTQAASFGVSNVARLKPDGSADSSFGGASAAIGANAAVLALALLPDGRIVLGGRFDSVQGQPRRGIARLKPDGSLDSLSASNPVALSGTVKALASLPSGSFVAGGVFQLSGQPARGLFKN